MAIITPLPLLVNYSVDGISRRAAGTLQRTFIIKASLAAEAAARIAVDIKSELLCRNLQADVFIKFIPHRGERVL